MLRAPFMLLWNILSFFIFCLKSILFRLAHFITRKKTKWVRLRLPQRLAMGPPQGLAAYFKDSPTFLDLRSTIDVIGDDERIEGVVLSADDLTIGPGRLGDIRELVQTLQARGKKVVFHAHSLRDNAYDLAAEADDILFTPGGRLYLYGPRLEQFFGSALLERLGISAQFVHIGPFKGAAHRFIHQESTRPLDLMMQHVVDEIYDIRSRRIEEGRSLDDDELDGHYASMPLDDRQAEALGLIDGRLHRSLIHRWILDRRQAHDLPPGATSPAQASRRDTDDAPPSQSGHADADADDASANEPRTGQVWLKDAFSYAEGKPSYSWSPLFRSPGRVALMDLSGMIVMPKMEVPGPSVVTIDPHEVLPKLRQIQNDPRVQGAILHINSPGGNALASEMIWDGIRQLRQTKPVIAYCSDVAASGGYYLACGADRIVCQPDTITGSIGVVAGKFSLPRALDKADIGHSAYFAHDISVFNSIAEPLSDEAMNNLLRDARSFYRQFLRRVGEARQLPRRRLHRYARGRIYTGASAQQRHLVDELGGFQTALELLHSIAGDKLSSSPPLDFVAHRSSSIGDLIRQSTLAPNLELPQSLTEAQLLLKMSQAHPLLAIPPYAPSLIS